MKPTIAGYVRCSTAEQRDSGLGLEGQRAALQRHAAAVGAELTLYEDAGCSGAKREGRPALEALMEKARAGELSGVVVVRLDRLARRLIDSLTIAGELEALGLELVDLSCPAPITGAFGRFSFQLRAAVAELERSMISERTTAALAVLRERGVKLGGSEPLGLAKDGTTTDRFSTVRLVFKLSDDGLSYRAIASMLGYAGVATARGGRWWASTVRALVSNEKLRAAVAAGEAVET